jgi:1,4-dihydroxy-2-naphthoate octaprenyltransferase
MSVLIFLVILVNEFPDLAADAAVNKKTLVVLFGVRYCVWIYRIAVVSTFVIMVTGVFISRVMAFPVMLYFLFGLPAAVAAISFVNTYDVSTPGPTQHRASAITIFLHLLAALTLSAGFLVWTFVRSYMG